MLIGCVVWCVAAMSIFAQDSTPETSLQIYKVGDLVSYNTVNQAAAWSRVSPKIWQAEHAETTESLERLASLVTSLCSTKPVVIGSYQETLSLVVRHTAEGHREIVELLQMLRTGNEPSIRMRCQPMGNSSSEHLRSLPAEKQERAEELVMQKILTPDEAREVMELVAPDPEFARLEETVQLVVGRKTSWGQSSLPATATARMIPGQRLIQLRIDNVVDDLDEFGDTLPVASQVFDIQEGSSAVWHQFCDGGTLVWLITPSIIGPSVADNAAARTTATK